MSHRRLIGKRQKRAYWTRCRDWADRARRIKDVTPLEGKIACIKATPGKLLSYEEMRNHYEIGRWRFER
jgi:hypothetical protein